MPAVESGCGMSNNRKPDGFSLIAAAGGGLILLFVAAPLLGMLFHSPAASLVESARAVEVRRSIGLTLWTSMAATLVIGVLAVPFAYLLARRDFPLKRWVIAVIDLPVVIPHSAAGIALLGVLNRDSFAGGLAEKAGFSFVGGAAGVMAAMAFVSLPFLMNAAREGFAAVPVRLEKAAMTLGASSTRVFFTIALPLAWRSVLSGMIMMFARGLSEFGAVIVIAYHPMVTPVFIYEQFTSFGLAASRSVAVLFIGICLVVFVILRLLSGARHAER